MRKYFALALILLVWLCVPKVQAAQEHSHCVCGGSAEGVADHQCQQVQWKPLSSVVDLSDVNWKDVPSGYYYLDGDVTVTEVTDSNAIGQVTKNADNTYTVKESREVSICLNGHNITTAKDRVFKGVYTGSTLNICDCSGKQNQGIWQWDGTIIGGTGGTGGITYTYANSSVNIYGGNITAKEGHIASTGGGLFFVAQDRSESAAGTKEAKYASSLNIYNGNLYGGTSGKNGGNIYVAHCSILNVYGGAIHHGTAASGGNISASSHGKINLLGGRIYGGYPEVAKLVTDGAESQEYTLEDAWTSCQPGSFIRLYRDLETELTLSGDAVLDLNGCDLSGVTVTGTLTCFDSKTQNASEDLAGRLKATGQIAALEGYLPVNENGLLSFHHYVISTTHISIDPSCAAFGYKSQLQGDPVVQAQITHRGYEMWLEGYEPHIYRKSAAACGAALTLRLKNILSVHNTTDENSQNAHSNIYARAFAELPDGSRLWSEPVAYNYRDALEYADDHYSQYSKTQQQTLQTMARTFGRSMLTWDVENFHHADDSWQNFVLPAKVSYVYKEVDGQKKSVTVRLIPEGSYVLTQDLDLNNTTLGIAKGTTVNLCLNGKTVTGTNRMLRIYGTFNLCDCHEGQHEGTMVSSYASTEESARHGAVFYTYYTSIFNLYGGNLKATGTLTSAGVGAVSHEAQDDPAVAGLPSGVMNMYGGTIQGGTVTGNGGLVTLYHGGSFHMFGGEMFNGKAGGHGGALYTSGSSQVGLYGGRIHNCQLQTTDNSGNTVLTPDGVYISSGQLILAGDVQVEQLYLRYNCQMYTDDLTPGARIGLSCDVHGFLAENTALADCFQLQPGYTPKVINGRLVAVRDGLTEQSAPEGFRVGYGTMSITPAKQGLPLSGYGNSADRTSTAVWDDLYVSATAITDAQNNTVLLITCDLQRPQEAVTDVIRTHISRSTGVPFENIIISASHSHSTPDLYSSNALIKEYLTLLYNRFTQAALQAMATRVPATIEAGIVQEVKDPNSGKYMNFTRHYSYTGSDGQIHYYGDNFGSPPTTSEEKATLQHVAPADHSMQLLRFVRQGQKDVLLCNFAAHPTMTGGSDQAVISSDFVGPLRDTVQVEANCYFVFVQGAAGNMNPTSRISGEIPYGKDHYRQYGTALAQVVIDKAQQLTSVETGQVQSAHCEYAARVFKHTQEEVAKASEFNKLSYAEKKAQYAQWGYTSIFHASSILSKANLGVTENLELNVISIGSQIAFFTAPGELWAETGLEMKADSPFTYTFTNGYSNGDWKYFTDGAAADGTYESYEGFYTRFVAPDTIQGMKAYWKEALNLLHSNT